MMDGMGMMVGWGFLVFLLIVLVIAVIVAGFRWTWRHEKPRRDNALEILKERYARGEISKDEFDKMQGDLRHWEYACMKVFILCLFLRSLCSGS